MEKCLICGEKLDKTKKVDAQDYTYLVCSKCKGLALTPRTKAIKKLKEVYKSEYFDWEKPDGLKKILYSVRLFEPYSNWIERLTAKKGKILDVGAGITIFVRKMRKFGWDVYAQELSKEQGKLLKKELGSKNVYVGDFEKVKLPKVNFDCLTFWHVFEHVKFPINTIKKSKILLNKGGYIFIEVPNAKSLTWKIFGNNYSLLSIPAHLFYYSEKSIRTVLNNAGFEVVEVSYPLKYNSTFAVSALNFINKKFGLTDENTKAILYYVLIPFSLIFNLLTSFVESSEVLRVAAKKK